MQAAIQLQILLQHFRAVLFGQPQNLAQMRVIAAQGYTFFNIFFHLRGLLQSHLGGGFVGMNQAGHAQQCAAEIANHHHQNIGQPGRINLAQNRPAGAARRFAVVVGAKL